MTNLETKSQPKRQRLAEAFLERSNNQPCLSKMADPRPALEKQFKFPQKVWDKLRAKSAVK